jgi:hypothetical protein
MHRALRTVLLPAVLLSSVVRVSAPQTLTAEQAREDFDVLWKAVREAHGGLLRFQTRSELESKVSTQRARLVADMPLLSFAGTISESLAELRDGHARLEYDKSIMDEVLAARTFPLRVVLEDGKLIVSSNDSPADTTIRPGMEVVSVNGRVAGDIVRQLLPKLPADGFIETGKRYRLGREFPVLYWLYVEQAEEFRIVMRDRNREFTVHMPGVAARNSREIGNAVNRTFVENFARLDGPSGNVAVDYPGGGNVARLQVRAFGGNTFLAALDSAFRGFRERGTASLVLDLRGNGGGVDEFGAALVSYFVEQPFRYFDHIWVPGIAPSFATWPSRTFDDMRTGTVADPAGGFRITSDRHPGVAEQRPAATPFTGKLAVLIDGGTFSTAADVAAQLRSMKRGTFIGEETAGGYEGNTSGLNALVVLPNSKLRLRIMMYDYWNAVAPPAQRGRGTIPDIVLSRRIADVLRGVDPVLERAMAAVR